MNITVTPLTVVENSQMIITKLQLKKKINSYLSRKKKTL